MTTATPEVTPSAPAEAGPLPAGVTRTASGTFRARLGARNLGTFGTVAEAVAAVETARADLGLPPLATAPEPARAPREARPLPLTAPPERWWKQARARIDAIVERVEREGDGWALPPDPRKHNAPR